MIKRFFDILLLFPSLFLLSPILIMGYFIACVDTWSNGLFSQKRVGKNGNLFIIYKLKTMHSHTKKISAIGSFLRKTKIDELPQLVNVLKGDMSFVGPRPDIEGYYDKLEGENRKILQLKPGITSLASIKYSNEEEILQQVDNPLDYNDNVIFPDKVKMNLDYYYHKSLGLDIKIIFLTLMKIFTSLAKKKNSIYTFNQQLIKITEMNKPKIWLSSPHMGGNEKKYVQEAFDTNWVAPLGPNVSGFEQDLEHYLGDTHHVAALSSGTAALHLGLILLDVQPGDEVICQSMTFSASANPIAYLGATPVFVDSEPETWNICPIALEEAIIDRISKGKKPKAIIAVHLYGMPFKVTEVMAVAEKYDIPVLEDSAEALGSTFQGRHCGTFGQLAALSFNGNKIITTSGGGALVSSQKEHKDKAVFLATQARDAAPHYQHSSIGYNYRLSNICAGIGRGQMEVLDKHIALRRKMHDFYVDLFKEVKGVTVFCEPNTGYFSNHWLSCIVIEPEKTNGVTRETLRLAMEVENIECRPLWKPMHLQPVFEQYPYYGGKVSENLFENGLCLPSGSNLTETDCQRIALVVKTLFIL